MISGYLDPASGSVLISIVAGGAAGAGVAAKTMMAKMRLKKRVAEEEVPAGEEEVPTGEVVAPAVDEPTQ
jgi:hypothetical protein